MWRRELRAAPNARRRHPAHSSSKASSCRNMLARNLQSAKESVVDLKPGNRKGTDPGPPGRTGRTKHTAIVLRTPPPVLNGTAANCGPPVGTKRPQVQILSPDHSRSSLLRECFSLQAVSHVPQSRQSPRWNKRNTRETRGPPSTGRTTPGLPARRSRSCGTAGLQGFRFPLEPLAM
jgi:hypothetical protein